MTASDEASSRASTGRPRELAGRRLLDRPQVETIVARAAAGLIRFVAGSSNTTSILVAGASRLRLLTRPGSIVPTRGRLIRRGLRQERTRLGHDAILKLRVARLRRRLHRLAALVEVGARL